MAWVGFAFYALHAPSILTAMGAGTRLLALTSCPSADEEDLGDGGEQVAHVTTDVESQSLTTPLISSGQIRRSFEGSSSLPISVNRSPSGSERQSHGQGHLARKSVEPGQNYTEDIRQPRVSLPGHYGSLSRHSSHRQSGHTGVTGTSPPATLASHTTSASRAVHFGAGSIGSIQAAVGGGSRGRGGGMSSQETTPPQSNTPVSGSHNAQSVFSGAGSLGYLAPGTHDGDGLLGGASARDEDDSSLARVAKM
jgi:hypothetical protein